MKNILALALLIALSISFTEANVTALFHPYDDTFGAITERFEKAQETIDMALYNLDDSDNNPIIAFINSEETQKRLKSGELKIRLIFEGYEKKEKNFEKMMTFEAMGIDVRTLGMSKKMHHKFATIDSRLAENHLITGSANWSMMSRRHYSENILFFDGEDAVTTTYQAEFDFLWSIAKEVGRAVIYDIPQVLSVAKNTSDAKVYFNTENFEVKRGSLHKKREIGFHLTKRIVEVIDNADSSLEIATTRLKLRPIYNAILRAAKRGVKVDIIVTMGEYEHVYSRRRKKVQPCENEFKRECSSGQNFAMFLGRNNYEGHENVNVRVKFFNLNTAAYLNKQMHSKYLIIDKELLLTGSFNWSYSGEFNHIENVVELHINDFSSAVSEFQNDFDNLWDLRRKTYRPFRNSLYDALENGTKIKCSFDPISLTIKEIDGLLLAGKKFKKKTRSACK